MPLGGNLDKMRITPYPDNDGIETMTPIHVTSSNNSNSDYRQHNNRRDLESGSLDMATAQNPFLREDSEEDLVKPNQKPVELVAQLSQLHCALLR